jgi:hypothetical protein
VWYLILSDVALGMAAEMTLGGQPAPVLGVGTTGETTWDFVIIG